MKIDSTLGGSVHKKDVVDCLNAVHKQCLLKKMSRIFHP